MEICFKKVDVNFYTNSIPLHICHRNIKIVYCATRKNWAEICDVSCIEFFFSSYDRIFYFFIARYTIKFRKVLTDF